MRTGTTTTHERPEDAGRSDGERSPRQRDLAGESVPSSDELREELDDVRSELAALRADLQRERSAPAATSSRRQLIRLAGATAVGAVGATVAGGGRAAAADPNDVVKSQPNAVTDTTTLQGSFPGPVFSLFNEQVGGTATSLYAYVDAPGPTVRADNDDAAGIGGVGLGGNAPGGRDVHAFGSGRIAMDDHDFGPVNEYTAGEIHQSGGTLYAMVTPTVRRVVAGPATAGALVMVDPTRVYDSRTPLPSFGRLEPGQTRVIDVDDGRNVDTGAVTVPDLVPADATAIVFNLTITATLGRGFLFVSPPSRTTVTASTINWGDDGAVAANTSVVGLEGTRQVRVHCGGLGSTDFVIDVLGYYR